MVDALQEIWCALASDGTLIDLRPVPSQCPIEVVTPGSIVHVGEADASGMAADDEAADRAIRDAVEQGWFVLRRDTRFDFDFYWDSVHEKASFIDGSIRMKQAVPSYADLEKVHRDLSTRAQGVARIRCRRQTMLAVYCKASIETL
ncbi:MAG: hypothetical protein GWN55_10185 [Phycisphaerae bacterium]|nr:hypothetical protein [candidate division KSB1 bacterium]NIV01671.1 hypothetical protein [Phycisphaerae bacterium]NIR70877.1 hypothetical protein [candidate division KSB1 bacterium]NIS26069.1 hypothetical protein [candidate division KSB1 bacterium]NIT72869.1 hypothetical protein [candidate division KSB1 bacterium]